jgi:ectoine hydroxylase-related dioxygenase (phytanoyl-CoA dioxygenase family)
MTVPETAPATSASQLLDRLNTDGIAILPSFVQGETLAGMQRAFESRLQRLRWNNFEGYEQTERFRLMVENVLTIDPGFLSTALHPLVAETLQAYVGERYQLVEAKGWRSIPTRRVFHAWHADSWYDKQKITDIPREAKLGLYLTDVDSGAFRYIRGSHRQHQPRDWRNDEIEAFPPESIALVKGAAGTAFLFDTTGIHGQSWPILERRHAVFFNYHDPAFALQQEDIEGGRYMPLLLNAAFLGSLSAEQQRVLGFGDRTNFDPAFERKPRHTRFQSAHARTLVTKMTLDEFGNRVLARLRRIAGR